MEANERDQLIEYLSGFITPERWQRMQEVLQYRTKYITVVVEDIFQPHNASAVLRSCDCFGIQDVHIIENRNKYEVNPDVAMGSSRWLTLHRYQKADNEPESLTKHCVNQLKQAGFRIVATTPHEENRTLGELDLNEGPVALMFGTELKGLTDEALELADEWLRIPMYGFTESFNISVSAALCLYDLTERLRKSELDWKMNPDESATIMLEWLRGNMKGARAESIEARFYENRSNPKNQKRD